MTEIVSGLISVQVAGCGSVSKLLAFLNVFTYLFLYVRIYVCQCCSVDEPALKMLFTCSRHYARAVWKAHTRLDIYLPLFAGACSQTLVLNLMERGQGAMVCVKNTPICALHSCMFKRVLRLWNTFCESL